MEKLEYKITDNSEKSDFEENLEKLEWAYANISSSNENFRRISPLEAGLLKTRNY